MLHFKRDFKELKLFEKKVTKKIEEKQIMSHQNSQKNWRRLAWKREDLTEKEKRSFGPVDKCLKVMII